MDNKSELIMNYRTTIGTIISWLFGILVLVIGLINTIWGNDPGFGIFLVLLSLVYFPPVNVFIKKKFGFAIPLIARILLGLFIIWASLGVGELFDKIDMMLKDF